MADYTTPFSNLGNLLGGLSANTPETPYSIEITSMSQYEFSNVTDSSVTTINAVLKNNPSKYVEITVADTCECCTKTVYQLRQIFKDCTNLVGCDISNVRGEKEVQALDRTFEGCTSLKWFELPSNTTYLGGAFKGCTGLESIDLRGFFLAMDSAFEGCTNLTDVKIALNGNYCTKVFKDCTSLTNIDGITYGGTKDLLLLFQGCTSLASFDKDFSYPPVDVRCTGMFEGCTSLSRVNTSFFRYCKYLSDMFSGCTALTEIDTSNFGAAEYINNMFEGCSALTEINATPFENVTYAQRAFAGSGITSIDISSMKSVTSAESMFENCAGLAEIHGWDLPRDAAINDIFKGCSSLKAVHTVDAPVDSGKWHLVHVRVSPDGSTADIDIHSDGGEKTTVTGVSLADGAYGVVFPVAVDDLYVGDCTDLSAKIQEYLSERYPWSTRWQTDALDASKKNFVLWSRDRASARTNVTTDVVEAGNYLPPTSAAVQAAIEDVDAQSMCRKPDYSNITHYTTATTSGMESVQFTAPDDCYLLAGIQHNGKISTGDFVSFYKDGFQIAGGSFSGYGGDTNIAGPIYVPKNETITIRYRGYDGSTSGRIKWYNVIGCL